MVVVVVPVVLVAIRAVVVRRLAARAFPIAGEVLLAIVMWADPPSAFIRRTRPVPVVPYVLVVVAWVPVAREPHISRARAPRFALHAHHGWRADSDPDRELRCRRS